MAQSCMLFLHSKGLQLSLLMPWVCFAVDVPSPSPLHQVTVLATLLEDGLGLEPQGRLQEGQRVAGERRGHSCAGLCTCRDCNTQGTSQQRGERSGCRCVICHCVTTQMKERVHSRNHHFPYKKTCHIVAESRRERKKKKVVTASSALPTIITLFSALHCGVGVEAPPPPGAAQTLPAQLGGGLGGKGVIWKDRPLWEPRHGCEDPKPRPCSGSMGKSWPGVWDRRRPAPGTRPAPDLRTPRTAGGPLRRRTLGGAS